MFRTDSAGRITHIGDYALETPDHPIYPAPTVEVARRASAADFRALVANRQDALVRMRNDPHRYGFEPRVWKLADALIEWPWLTEEERERAKRIRKNLGFDRPVRTLLINGGNRGTKTDYAAKRCNQFLMHKPKAKVAAWQSTGPVSISELQPRVYHYLPAEYKEEVRTKVHYLKYSMHGGFSENKFILPNASSMEFRNYAQGLETIEGIELDIAWPDEFCPLPLFESLKGRVATAGRFGLILNTFTPLDGYTPLVADYREAATCVLDATGYMLPLDADGKPDLAKALAVDDLLARAERPATPKTPEALKYRSVPRVERSRDDGRGVMFFHTMDNTIVPSTEGLVQRYPRELLMRLYGVAEKSFSAKLPFDDTAHKIKASAVPTGGTIVQVVDPAPGRNWSSIWLKFHKNAVYLYREWPPRKRPVRGHGVLGAWVEPAGKRGSGDRGGVKYDGYKGPGQTSLNWGLRRYKEEFAEVEGWEDYALKECGTESVDAWREFNGAKERVFKRIMDSRFASSAKQENDRSVTAITQFEDIGLWFDSAPGTDIDGGLNTVIDLMYFDRSRPVDASNQPRFFVVEDCLNAIECMKIWTGNDGGEGASKDFIDLIRYGLNAGIGDVATADAARAKPRAGESTKRYY